MRPISLNELFKQKLFRIPDYQRGYSWEEKQYEDFWEDIVNLQDNRFHYAGVLSLKPVDKNSIKKSDNEFWLVEDHSYTIYDIIDGQQRLTTSIIFLQSLVEVIRRFPENTRKNDNDIFITESLNISSIIKNFLFEIKPNNENYRTYIFWYHSDNPSYQYMKHTILWEQNPWTIQETFYTRNLKNAKTYFIGQIEEIYRRQWNKGLENLYKKISKNFLFNEYIIDDDFNVYVAFETMNNRGKSLSHLELLKNRLIYLTTLYWDDILDEAEKKHLRDSINDAWKEVYYQLWRNKDKKPLNDDDFLKAHWAMTFKYSRKSGDVYINYLLNEYFTPKRVFQYTSMEVNLDENEEVYEDEFWDYQIDDVESNDFIERGQLLPQDIEEYVWSLKNSVVHWFDIHYPYKSQNSELTDNVRDIIDKLNRVGIWYFRTLVMSVLKNIHSEDERLTILSKIENYIFLSFRIGRALSNYGDSEFYNAARELDTRLISINNIIERLDEKQKFLFHESGEIKISYFYTYLEKNFSNGWLWYYWWNGLHYFLYEYEIEKMKSSGQPKIIDWQLFIKSKKDRLSIEHIFPQTPNNEYWEQQFSNVPKDRYYLYNGSLWNLLLLSSSINSSLQNDSYLDKKKPKLNEKWESLRKWYADGSHSEIEVTQLYNDWWPEEIRHRWLKLLEFLEKRWGVRINPLEKEKLLFLTEE